MAASSQTLLDLSNQGSPLLDLISELRNSVYHLVLVPDEEEHVEITFKEIEDRTSLLRTCSQIRREATEIFYASNSFVITDVLGHQAETYRFMRNAGANARLIPAITATIKLPQLFMRVLYLLFQARPDAEDAQKSIGEAYTHVLKTMHSEIQSCGKRLIDGGIASLNIEVMKCLSDWWDDRYGEFVAAFEMRLTDAATQGYIEAIGQEWPEDKFGPDTW